MPNITIAKTVDAINVDVNPNVSATKPPMIGAMIVAGAVNVCDKPMYMGRSASLAKSTVMVMPIVQMETFAIPAKTKIG